MEDPRAPEPPVTRQWRPWREIAGLNFDAREAVARIVGWAETDYWEYAILRRMRGAGSVVGVNQSVSVLSCMSQNGMWMEPVTSLGGFGYSFRACTVTHAIPTVCTSIVATVSLSTNLQGQLQHGS